MAKPKLTLYLDIVSPFAYLAFHLVSVSLVSSSCCVVAFNHASLRPCPLLRSYFFSHAQWAKAVFSPSLLRPASSLYLSHAEVSGDANFA